MRILFETFFISKGRNMHISFLINDEEMRSQMSKQSKCESISWLKCIVQKLKSFQLGESLQQAKFNLWLIFYNYSVDQSKIKYINEQLEHKNIMRFPNTSSRLPSISHRYIGVVILCISFCLLLVDFVILSFPLLNPVFMTGRNTRNLSVMHIR